MKLKSQMPSSNSVMPSLLTAEHGGDLLPVQMRPQAMMNLFTFGTGLPLSAINESNS
ncbi:MULTISPECIES: hypothetical protein [unclassified Mesorhizobium]|uniref:hypothetical protein n=1 Tax=unclassified Mesorhizobium TaxID=325217 RepID=UPI0013E3192F|nr:MULTISPECIES: hypothetical protein [unclassified Mesorhizobium]